MENNGKVTLEVYNTVKTLLNNGLTGANIARMLKLSTATVSYVKNSVSHDDYRAQVVEHSAKKRHNASKAEKPQGNNPHTAAPQVMNPTVVRIEATHYMMQEMQKTNELLTLISRKLAFIVDELCGTKAKEG